MALSAFPVDISQLLNITKTSCVVAGHAAGIAVAMLCASLMETLGQAHYLNQMLNIGMNIRVRTL